MENMFIEWAAQYCSDTKHINIASSAQMQQLLFGEWEVREKNMFVVGSFFIIPFLLVLIYLWLSVCHVLRQFFIGLSMINLYTHLSYILH